MGPTTRHRLSHAALLASAALLLNLLSGCSSAPTYPGEASAPPARQPASPSANQPDIPARLSLEQANDVTMYAISLVGTPYRWGGNTPDGGFDCSGLIGHVYKTRGSVSAPRTVASLVDWGQPVPMAALRSGDLVVFTQRGVSTHAGIYVGEGRFVHAPSTGGEVRLDSLDSKYWAKQQVSYRRP